MRENNKFYGKILVFNFLIVIIFSLVVLINTIETYSFEKKLNERLIFLETKSNKADSLMDFSFIDIPKCDGSQNVRCWVYEKFDYVEDRDYVYNNFNNSSFILVHYIDFDDKPKPLGSRYYRHIPLTIRYLNGSVVRDGVEMNGSLKWVYKVG